MKEGKLALYIFVIAVIVSSHLVFAGDLNYTEIYYWRAGGLTIPPDTREYISAGRIYVELPLRNISKAIDVRILPGVNTTFDCGLLIEDTLNGLPKSFTSNRRTTWYYTRRRPNRILAKASIIVNSTAKRHIFGTNDRYLRISEASQRNSGVYICRFCYDQIDFLSGRSLRTICNSSGADLNVTEVKSAYTETYQWKTGRLAIPNDERKNISTGRIYVELPLRNVSKVIDVRILPNVNTTFDCGLLIEDTLVGVPLAVIGSKRTTWYNRRRLINGSLSNTANKVTDHYGILIFGTNDRYLRIAEPKLSSQALLGNAGEYMCEFCYDQKNILTGGILRTVCSSSGAYLNIRGDKPTIKRKGIISSVGGTQVRIGTTICLDQISYFSKIICAQSYPITPITVARYTVKPKLARFSFFESTIRGEYGYNNVLYAFVSSLKTYKRDVNVTCTLSNQFGNDIETTKIQYNVTSSFNGSIDGVVGSQCSENPAEGVICPRVRQTVTLNCSTNQNNSYTISSGSRFVANRFLKFVMTENDYGNYICYSSNDCNTVTKKIILKKPKSEGHEEFCTVDNGSYYCNCKKGYRIKVSCEDIDECADPSLNDCTAEQECQNTLGGYKCLQLKL